MRYVIILAAVMSLLAGASVSATDGVEFAIDIYQTDSLSKAVRLVSDTSTVSRGITASGFFLSFSLDIELTKVDTGRAQFQVHVVTLGPPAKTYGRSFSVEYGLPARVEGIVGKGGATYELRLTPLGREEVDTTYCAFDHHAEGVFKFLPSANMDLYYVPNSYADFFMQASKGVLEHHYREFQAFFGFSMPGKFNVFLCPCAVPSVLWDARYGQAVNPTRSSSYTLLAKGMNSTDPFVVNHTALLRSWGYAPPFLSEGAANYLSYAIFDMKRLAASGQTVPIDSLLDTYAYLEVDPLLADRMSTTFVKYLIDTHGLSRFRELYESANDLDLRARLTAIYGKSVDVLDAEWRAYVDTFTIRFPQLAQEVERAEATFGWERMREYSQAMLDRSQGRIDSMFSLSNLKQAQFYLGNYYAASDAAKAHLGLEEEAGRNWFTLAAYQMMNGLYPEARENLRNGLVKDPSNQTMTFNLALSYLYVGDTATAESLLVEVVSKPEANSPQGEGRVMLGEILSRSASEKDRARATTYFAEAMQMFQAQMEQTRSLTTAYLWFGAAALGFKDTEAARTSLEMALFLETRPFYIGLINLWLGKAADALGDHATARDYYGAVLAGASADYTQQEARRYLDKPYTLK